jgi:hypothetical protein
MAKLSLSFQRIEFITDRNVEITAWRAFAEVEFLASNREDINYSCVVDPGAPFSVIPYSLWHDRRILWRRLGTKAKRKNGLTYERLDWQEVPCELGTTTVQLIDSTTGFQAGPFVVRAKFAQQRQQRTNLEIIAVLGMNLIADNDLRLVFRGRRDTLTGFLSFS